jgi:hypothetical protein
MHPFPCQSQLPYKLYLKPNMSNLYIMMMMMMMMIIIIIITCFRADYILRTKLSWFYLV